MMKCLLLFTLAVVSRAEQENPLGRVIGLLDDLAAKVTADGEAEQKQFQEFSAWCKDASANTRNDIKTLTSQKLKGEATIADTTAQAESDSSKIEDLASALAASDAELKEATAVRNKEAATNAASEKELVEVVDTLDRAITILSREMQKNPAAFNQVAAAANSGALVDALSAVADAAAFNGIDRQTLLGLAQVSQNSESDDSETGAPDASVYKSHSTNIFDLLEDLKEKAEGELSDLRKAEATAKHNYNMLAQSIKDQMSADEADKKEREASKLSAMETKANAEAELSNTEHSLATANNSLETANSNCMTVAADHEATVAARSAELKVIAQATQILKDTTAGAVGQSYSLLQISSKADLAGAEIVAMIKKLAEKQHSSALAQLSSRISATIKFSHGDDPFVKVRGLIQDMIAKLESEAKNDATEKAYCDEETAKTKSKNADLTSRIDKLTSKIDMASAKSTNLKAEVKELQNELAKLAKTQAEMNELRGNENSDYKKAKADLELGLSGVRAALSKLREYYGGAAFIQDKPMAELMQQPAVPEAHSKASGAGQSIIGILEVVESDFAKDLTAEETEEADAASAHEKMTQENEVTKTTKNQDVAYKTKGSKGLDKAIAEYSSDRDTQGSEREAVLEYLGQLNNRCIAKPETYEERKARRAAEINGLKEALNILEEVGGSFVQRKKRGSLRGAIQA